MEKMASKSYGGMLRKTATAIGAAAVLAGTSGCVAYGPYPYAYEGVPAPASSVVVRRVVVEQQPYNYYAVPQQPYIAASAYARPAYGGIVLRFGNVPVGGYVNYNGWNRRYGGWNGNGGWNGYGGNVGGWNNGFENGYRNGQRQAYWHNYNQGYRNGYQQGYGNGVGGW
ncbi:MAG: hypothetical protein KGH94_04355 [Candidatus Micrarchaeota archaeon]|nr:hypothetical protein [Candidatus Micrarchaeota archaeon]